MSQTHFIADLHLGDEQPRCTERFVGYTQGLAREAEALYILGDLFDAWIGDDDDAPTARAVVTALRELSTAGTAIYVQHGNRDFLIGEQFCQATGAQLLPDEHCIDLYGTPTLLMHGDLLCTDDVQYQAVRKQVRQPDWSATLLAQPLPVRRQLAAQYRQQSGEATSQLAADIMDVNTDAVEQAFTRHNVQQIIHGHTHRPHDHQLTIDRHTRQRRVLSDWHEDQGEVLQATASGIQRITV